MEFYYHEVDKDVLVISADGGLNGANADEFITSIQRLVDLGLRRLIVDCTNLTYVSSVGLSVLLRVNKRMRERGGDVKVCALRGPVAEVLRVTRLDRVFQVYPDLDQARAAFALGRDAAAT